MSAQVAPTSLYQRTVPGVAELEMPMVGPGAVEMILLHPQAERAPSFLVHWCLAAAQRRCS